MTSTAGLLGAPVRENASRRVNSHCSEGDVLAERRYDRPINGTAMDDERRCVASDEERRCSGVCREAREGSKCCSEVPTFNSDKHASAEACQTIRCSAAATTQRRSARGGTRTSRRRAACGSSGCVFARGKSSLERVHDRESSSSRRRAGCACCTAASGGNGTRCRNDSRRRHRRWSVNPLFLPRKNVHDRATRHTGGSRTCRRRSRRFQRAHRRSEQREKKKE